MILSIIIVNWNSKDYVRGCLTSLFRYSPATDWELIVVDSGSYDGCGEMLAKEFPNAVFVQSADNIGFARANNIGALHARGSFFLFLNPDTAFTEDSIGILMTTLDSLPDAGAVGCRLLNRDRTLQTSCVQAFPTVLNQVLDSDYLRTRFPNSTLWGTTALRPGQQDPSDVEALSGACILIKREIFERIGGFTERYFMYGEDLDLCFKIWRSGYRIVFIPNTEVVHFGGGSTARASSTFSTVMMRNSVYLFMILNRGATAAAAYRISLFFSALFHLLVIGPCMLFGTRIVRHGLGSFQKWAAILQWSLIGSTASNRSTVKPASSSSPITQAKTS